MADASTSSDFAKIPSWQCSDLLAIADIGFFANMAYTRVQRKILEIRLSELTHKCSMLAAVQQAILEDDEDDEIEALTLSDDKYSGL